MGIAIAGGVGLAIGLGLLVWALKERGKRHAAERKADQYDGLRKEAVDVANHNAARAADKEKESLRLSKEIVALHNRLKSVREAAAKSGSIKTVRKLLEEEGKPETI